MSRKIDEYRKVGVGAWAAKALYDETVTALLLNNFTDLRQFIDVFPEICKDYGGTAAALKLEKAAKLLEYHQQHGMAYKYLQLAENICKKPLAPSCLDLRLIQNTYTPDDLIVYRVESICEFLGCHNQELEAVLEREINSDCPPKDWHLQVSSIYSRSYVEWFTPFAINHLYKYLPQRADIYPAACLQVVDWSTEVWRCWRRLKNRPTLIDPGIFRPAQFFVWHIIHDSVHIWQMQAYGEEWSNTLSPEDFLLLEAQAMCVERKALELMLKDELQIPSWYPSNYKAVTLRLLIGLLEREIRLHLDLSIHWHGQSIDEWLIFMSKLTGISSNYFLGFTGELLGMPGFAAAYTVVTDAFISFEDDYRKQILVERKLPLIFTTNLFPYLSNSEISKTVIFHPCLF
ncbi:hypothetical protein SD81_016860 [Tolypothrix campylonemoides VB511288]|nr:hypothetical protein SD81_016860 [Tolypothrix campylonemoides VB511288]